MAEPAVEALIDGRYRLEQMLGRGGMGVVWRACDERLGRPVALKLVHASSAPDPAVLARFAREARVLATLDHPAIVSIFDFSAQHDPPYLVMQLVSGSTLENEAQVAPLEPERVRSLLAPVADALAFAHAQGIVHRDLKPANVLVDRRGRVRVTDFGLARLAYGESSITVGAQLIGSPEYWAPEQAAGRDVGTSADLYALGAMLFLLASGHLPFPTGEDRLQAGFRRIHEDAPSLASAAPDLERTDPDLVDLCDRLLARDPRRRPTATETADLLGPQRATETVAVAAPDTATVILPPSPTPRASAGAPTPRLQGTSRSRRRLLPILAVLGVALLTAALAVAAMTRGDDDDGQANDRPRTATTAPAAGGAQEERPATTAKTTPAATATAPATTPTTATAPATTTTTPTTATTPTTTGRGQGAATPPADDDETEDGAGGGASGGGGQGTPRGSSQPVVPANFATFRSQTCRFRHPQGWQISSRDAARGFGAHNEVRGGNGLSAVCDVDRTPRPVARMAAEIRQIWRVRRGYREHSYGPGTVAGRSAFIYEFTRNEGRGPERVKEAFFAPGVAMAVYAPESQWASQRATLDQVLASYGS